MSAEQLKEQVMRVLRVWEAWSVYPQPFLATLQETFLRPAPQDERNKEVPGTSHTEGEEDEDIDGIPRTLSLSLSLLLCQLNL
jgi:hypothetical protein